MAGATYSTDGDVSGNHGSKDVWIIKLDDAGNIQWQRALGGSNMDVALAIVTTTDGGYIVAGYTRSNDGDASGNHGDNDEWVVKLDDAGNIQWQRALGGSVSDVAWAIATTADGDYFVAGNTYSNNGDVSGNHGSSDAWVVKLGEDAFGIDESGANTFTIAPNPAHALLRIGLSAPMNNARITLSNALGAEVLQDRMSGLATTLDLGDLPRGLYVLTLRWDKGVSSQRVMLD